nr:reverse transcriptase domain-containing protein [Tanacetum cinerariifolium]
DYLSKWVEAKALPTNDARVVVKFLKSLFSQFGTLKAIISDRVKKVNDDVQLRALIDDKKVVVSEAIIRRDLHLDDADGVECLPNEEIFEELARIGYEKPPPKLTFYKAFFSLQWKFLIHTLVQCLSAKRTAWNEFSCSMASAVICLATGRKFKFLKYIFDSMVRNVDSPSKFLMYPRFLQVVLDHQVYDMTSHNTRYTSTALIQKVFANMMRVGKGFSGVETPLFAFMLVQPQPQAEEGVKDQLTSPHESYMPLLTTLMETCSTLSQKVAELEQDKHSQALEILQPKKRVLRRMHPNKGKIAAIDTEEGITLVDVETDKEVVAIDAETQEWLNQEDVSAAELTVFDDEDVTMTMSRTLIKLKAEKDKLLDEQIAQKFHDEEKPVSIAQARKNMIIYLKNMVGYKMKFFRGMTYDKIRPIFKRECKKVQTLFKQDKDVQEIKTKRVADETLLQKSFKKLRADMLKEFNREDLVSLWNLVKEKFSSAVPSEDKEKALWVELKRLFEPDADDVHWKLQIYMHAPLTWKLYTDYGVHHVSSTRGHDIFMFTEKDYPLSNDVMILMLSRKLQVEEDNEMARDLVMKIFMEANKPRSRSLDTSS